MNLNSNLSTNPNPNPNSKPDSGSIWVLTLSRADKTIARPAINHFRAADSSRQLAGRVGALVGPSCATGGSIRERARSQTRPQDPATGAASNLHRARARQSRSARRAALVGWACSPSGDHLQIDRLEDSGARLELERDRDRARSRSGEETRNTRITGNATQNDTNFRARSA